MLWCQGAQNNGLSNHKIKSPLKSQCMSDPDRQMDEHHGNSAMICSNECIAHKNERQQNCNVSQILQAISTASYSNHKWTTAILHSLRRVQDNNRLRLFAITHHCLYLVLIQVIRYTTNKHFVWRVLNDC